MRLLKSLTGQGFELTKDLDEDDIPQYAILSHTWGAAEEEVAYADIIDGTGKQKNGYKKLAFCAERARRDGQTYFWVDTCCIDKSNSVELNTAITSMYQWYAKATKCYVYLSDVSSTPSQTDCDYSATPHAVEFYDKAGEKIGDKMTLERHICDVTGIPAAALRDRPLSSFSIEERILWQMSRQTKKPEDEAYSLMGICGVSMVPIYGEGRVKAMARLRRVVVDEFQGPRRCDFSIPFSGMGMRGVENLIGREAELEHMHAALVGDGTRRAVTLNGLGGIGKTQLAVAYAKRQKDSYSAVFWLNIRDEASVKQSFAKIAERILRYHPSASHVSDTDLTGSLDEIVDAVLAWLGDSDNRRWLAIYDNYDNPRVPGNNDPDAVDIHRFLPDAYQGSVIITTRSSQVKHGQKISVRKLKSTQDSVDILVRRLDGLPLALATTGSYLEQASVSVAIYLRLYESSWAQLHQDDLGLETYEDRTLYSTWRVSFERIQEQNELSAKLLVLWCYFGNQDLWYELLHDGQAEHLPWLRDLTDSLPVFIKTMRILCNYGLAEKVDSTQPEIGEWLHDIADLFSDQNKMREAEEVYLRALRGKEEARGPKHTSTLNTVNNLAILYKNQGKMQEAEEMYLRALRGYEEAWGPKHTSTLDTVNNLAVLYKNQGKMQEAEEMYLRALRGYEEAWGPKHTSTLDTVNNLAILYKNQGKMQEAEEMYLRAIDGFCVAEGNHEPRVEHLREQLSALKFDDQRKAG
ncbi:hypothetical protein B0A55_11221 [Friedmanniomyces simplex]|uniref:Uncharacterized protein n=1 Tax=Friedmanniomyces simplex TaxID=329884 RepID=A0A4U0WKA2_9PEZI|nr:hypothetical protein B0A55_11221 [Friedmanniomyces simplex]